jgi:hypothetical protein
MKSLIGAATALVFALACSSAAAAPATVNLRVEGADATIFEGPVRTDGHAIEQDRSGPQPCDGTNGGANPTPGPTVTSALDDAVAWDGTWNAGFQDFLINRIGPDAASDTQFWGTALNWTPLEVGGCQAQVKNGDEVLWAYDLFSAEQYLRLRGPRVVRKGKRFRVRVVDAKDNDKPVRGAIVRGVRTNAKGLAAFRATKRGIVRLKATRRDALRSNSLFLRVR